MAAGEEAQHREDHRHLRKADADHPFYQLGSDPGNFRSDRGDVGLQLDPVRGEVVFDPREFGDNIPDGGEAVVQHLDHSIGIAPISRDAPRGYQNSGRRRWVAPSAADPRWQLVYVLGRVHG